MTGDESGVATPRQNHYEAGIRTINRSEAGVWNLLQTRFLRGEQP